MSARFMNQPVVERHDSAGKAPSPPPSRRVVGTSVQSARLIFCGSVWRNSVVSSGARHQANHEQDPAQKFGTAGINPIDRPSLVTRFFMSWHGLNDAILL